MPANALAQSAASAYPYLLRLERQSYGIRSCALIQTAGAFHEEIYDFGTFKVFKGVIGDAQLGRLKNELADQALAALSQKQIQEPLIRTKPPGLLQINVFRGHDWQSLIFLSNDSQLNYPSLKPIAQWLDNLHKAPHKEFSEDAGRNNCLPTSPIVLRKRGLLERANGPRIYPLVTTLARLGAPPAAASKAVPAWLLVDSLTVRSQGVRLFCIRINQGGTYRFEEKTQESKSTTVNMRVIGGQLTSDHISSLRQLLNDPSLEKLRHRETSRMELLPVLGETLNLHIARSAGTQNLVLSNDNSRDALFSLPSDGDVSRARDLMNFLAEHIENNNAGLLDSTLRNNCQSAP